MANKGEKRGRLRKINLSTLEGSLPARSPAVYRLTERDTRKVRYIGEASDLVRRVVDHARTGRADLERHDLEWKEFDLRSTSRTRREVERRWIEKHNPPLNQRGGGGGRHAT